MNRRLLTAGLAGVVIGVVGCRGSGGDSAVTVDKAQLAVFAPLPDVMVSASNPVTDAKVELGWKLFYEKQLSTGKDLSCNSCHSLASNGADTGAVSVGHLGKKGGRNSPTVFNAAAHLAQFWDGRAPDIEAQALGPILNPVEMAMPAAPDVMRRLKADSEYRKLFAAAFPGATDPMTYQNLGRAIGAFERKLVTPARWDDYLRGADSALTPAEKAGFNAFTAAGCQSCHNGALVGGNVYQKAGLARAWPDTSDIGREAVTRQAADRMVFKVPSLRNVALTAPYFHNGGVRSLDTAVVWMGRHQLGKELTPAQVGAIVTWLGSLTGKVPAAYVAPPQAGTPKPD